MVATRSTMTRAKAKHLEMPEPAAKTSSPPKQTSPPKIEPTKKQEEAAKPPSALSKPSSKTNAAFESSMVTAKPTIAPKVSKVAQSDSKGTSKKPAVVGARVSKTWPGSVGKQKVKGLSNPHNWCYRRSLLQSLLSVPQFFNLLDGSHKECTSAGGRCVTCGLRQLVRSYHAPGGNLSGDLTRLDQAIKVTGRKSDPKWYGTGSSQEDSHEFLQYLLGTVEKAKGVSHPQFASLFSVGHRTNWKCNFCEKKHSNADPPSYSLQLPISAPRGQQVTMTSCLEAYHREENLTIRCDGCKKNSPRTRLHRIESPPEILMIQLKRFAFNGYNSLKNNKPVQFAETLDLSRWTVEPSKPANYRLQAVVAHSGSLKLGHYVAFVRGPDGIRRISDESVSKAHEGEWRNPKGFAPYILLYIKQ